MLDPKRFEDLAARLGSVLAASPVGDMQKNAQALLSSFFSKLDLVSREEFDIQTQVLLRTREKLKALEARLEVLEKQANYSTTKADTGSGT
jgi:BMFP domain-containing protein YqiC